MATPSFMWALIDLARCDAINELLKAAVSLLEYELRVSTFIEVWSEDGKRFVAGDLTCANAPHRTWIGVRYTVGAIRLQEPPSFAPDVEIAAYQLAPLAELLMERDAARRLTIREDIERLYQRRIRDALVRCDWNASAVARELGVSRSRVADVTRRWRHR